MCEKMSERVNDKDVFTFVLVFGSVFLWRLWPPLLEFLLLHLSGDIGGWFRVDLEGRQAVPTDDCMSDVTQLGACVADAVDATVLASEA